MSDGDVTRLVRVGLVHDDDGYRVCALVDGRLSRYEPAFATVSEAAQQLETVTDLWAATLRQQGLRFTERHVDEGDE